VINQISAENREPTMWEGKYLFAALTAMATGDYLVAETLIDLARREVSSQAFPRTEITLEGLRAGLAQVGDCGDDAFRGEGWERTGLN
jgi:hypothetical protein